MVGPSVRILAVFALDIDRAASFGLWEKALALTAAARSSALAVDVAAARGSTLFFESHEASAAEQTHDAPAAVAPGALLRAYFRYDRFWRKLLGIPLHRYAAVWVRAFPTSPAQLNFLTAAKKAGCRIVLDLPTYPYRYDGPELWKRLGAIVGAWFDTRRMSLVDRVVTLSPDHEIGGVPTLRVRNGGAVVHGETSRPARTNNGPYHFVGVGQWARAHGLSRLLEHVASSPLHREFKFTLAGEGPLVPELRALSARLPLRIHFEGSVYGDRRRELIESGDVGVGALSYPGDGVEAYFPLKHRLYAAEGIPFIGTALDPDFADHVGVCAVRADELPPVAQLLAFAREARSSREAWGDALRATAEDLTWGKTYAPLFDYFLTLEGPVAP